MPDFATIFHHVVHPTPELGTLCKALSLGFMPTRNSIHLLTAWHVSFGTTVFSFAQVVFT